MKHYPRYDYPDLPLTPFVWPRCSLLTAFCTVARRLWAPIADAWWETINLTWSELT